jgi:hypothetical protein
MVGNVKSTPEAEEEEAPGPSPSSALANFGHLRLDQEHSLPSLPADAAGSPPYVPHSLDLESNQADVPSPIPSPFSSDRDHYYFHSKGFVTPDRDSQDNAGAGSTGTTLAIVVDAACFWSKGTCPMAQKWIENSGDAVWF